MSSFFLVVLIVSGVAVLTALARLGVLAVLAWRTPRSRGRSVARAADVLACLALIALIVHSIFVSVLPGPVLLGAWWLLVVPLACVIAAGLAMRFRSAQPQWRADRVRMLVSGGLALVLIGLNVFAG